MAIADTWQRQGVGQYLMGLVEQEALTQGINTITLKARENAIPFYQSIGFTLGDYSHTLYDNIVHFTMTKKLAESIYNKFATQLTALWHNTIPISKTMQIACVYVDVEKLITTADKIANQNLHHTMFAGSQYSLLTLTGWGWVYYLLNQQHLVGDIVLAKANIRYLTPCHGHVHAITTSAEPVVDLSALNNNKKVKVSLQVTLFCGDTKVAIFDGDYAVIPKTIHI
jgi:thioesterase domain-containing protein